MSCMNISIGVHLSDSETDTLVHKYIHILNDDPQTGSSIHWILKHLKKIDYNQLKLWYVVSI